MNKGEAIAPQLRQAREQQGKSIQQLQQHTGVSMNVLHGLETGDFGVVESVYTRLALRTCAEYLGLDAEALVRQYDAEFGKPLPAPVPPPRPATPVSRPSAPASRPPAGPNQPEGFGSLTRLLVICTAGLAVVFAAVYWFDRGDSADERGSGPQLAPIPPEKAGRLSTPTPAAGPVSSQDPYRPSLPVPDSLGPAGPPSADLDVPPLPLLEPAPPAPSSVSDLVPRGPATLPTPATAPATVPGAAPPVAASPVAGPVAAPPTFSAPSDSLLVLEVEALDSTWVRVEWDQGGQFETVLRRGARRRWEARDHFVVQSGRGHGVRLWFQGRPIGADGLVGDPNRVLRVRLSREGMKMLSRDMQPMGAAPAPRDTAAATRPDSAP